MALTKKELKEHQDVYNLYRTIPLEVVTELFELALSAPDAVAKDEAPAPAKRTKKAAE